MMRDIRYWTIGGFLTLVLLSIYLIVTQIKFDFDFLPFFPTGDPDLEFFQEFQTNFENDNNALLVALENKPDIFDSVFLAKVHELTLRADTLPGVTGVQSITTLEYPVIKPPFFFMKVPAIHKDDASQLDYDRKNVLKDKLLVNNLVSKDGKATVIVIKNIDRLEQAIAEDFMNQLEAMILDYEFDDYHFLGRSNFQKELVRMQKRELMVSMVIAFLITMIIMAILFQRIIGIMIAMISIGVSMVFFGGFMSAFGRTFTAMAALYPVMMTIVATSDVIHFLSKYVDELRKGFERKEAIRTTVREIGIATLLTSLTTAAGFISLMTSRIPAIRDFGLNAAIGVLLAYVVVLVFTSSILSFFKADQLMKAGFGRDFWTRWMTWFYDFTKAKGRPITIGALVFGLVCAVGIGMISTNYQLEINFPKGAKMTNDFKYFEEEFAGFRPYEIAVMVEDDYEADDYEVLKEMEKIEQQLATYDNVANIYSATAIYKGINRANNGNRVEEFVFPETQAQFIKYRKYAKRVPAQSLNVLVSDDKKSARITARVLDIGANNVQVMSEDLDGWIAENIDQSIIKTRITGTSLMLDKNAEYIRKSLLSGLAIAVLIVSILMAILFKNWQLVVISLIPNMLPLLVAGAILGYFGIELEAGVSVVFAVIFGIAVDDTIHFLSKYKLARNKGLDMEEAMLITFTETGKALCLTTLILFAGFLVLLFSIHPPSVIIGTLISITLFSALFSDLLLIPVLIRFFAKKGDKI